MYLVRSQNKIKKDYKIRLEASVICDKYLLHMIFPFRGHNESEESNNRGNYIELLNVASVFSTDIRKVITRNPGNLQLTSPGIQKDIVNAASMETLKAIFEELGDDLFAILVDESGDVSYKEQMAIVLRFVNEEGIVVEHFVRIVHITDTSALSLKSAIDELFDEYELSISSIRGQRNDGASNMRGKYGGELRAIIIAQAINNGEIEMGNQELGIKRPYDTRWGSHYRSLLNLQESFFYVIDVLEFIYNDVSNSSHKKNARGLMAYLHLFDFVFILHLMVDVHQFCYSYDTDVVEIDDNYVAPKRPKRRAAPKINLHHYCVDIFYAIIDLQLQELNSRCDEVNTELLRCLSCLSPKDGFRTFDLSMLEKMASFYPYGFDVFRKNIIYPHVYLLLKLALILPVATARATATVEIAFSAMKFLNDCLVTYIERDIFESISIESIVYRF
ncbi:hypothetical protein RND81_12G029900 [Saponaria officinalis]|uniref:DUF4371 domain-containing protein n=1 Tax=Saponaria officinalis TaxID=3572 RepID=A0AAW1H4F3_SAPOF